MDTSLVVNNLEEVTLELVVNGIERAMSYGNTSDNILFPNGDNVYIYGTEVDAPAFYGEGTYHTMRSSISFRNYVGICELLVRDSEGQQLIYNKIKGLSKDELAKEYYHEICLVRHLIDGVAENCFQESHDAMIRESIRKIKGVTA